METKIYITMGAKFEDNSPIILGIYKSLESAKRCRDNMIEADKYYNQKQEWYYWIQTDYLFD